MDTPSTTFRRRLTNSNFSQFAQQVAFPSAPTDYSPAAMERLMEYLDPYVVNMKNMRFPFHARNKVQLIQFSTREEKEAYDSAWDAYLEACALLEEGGGENTSFMILVQFLKFRQAAELIRAPYLAKRLYEIVYKKGRSAVCACNFKETIAKITRILCDDYGVSRDEISLIWGGIKPKKPSSKVKKDFTAQDLELFDTSDLEFLSSLGIETSLDVLNETKSKDTPERRELDRLKLGNQNKRARQEEIDKFQSDRSKFCLFTFKAGGVGLSLHQELPEHRVRETLLAPTYSAIELVQGLGRAHRITSCSDTDQTIVFYANTIEVRVSVRASQKLKCLSKAVRQKESWESVIYGQEREEYESENSEEDKEEETDGLLGGGSTVDEEEEDEE